MWPIHTPNHTITLTTPHASRTGHKGFLASAWSTEAGHRNESDVRNMACTQGTHYMQYYRRHKSRLGTRNKSTFSHAYFRFSCQIYLSDFTTSCMFSFQLYLKVVLYHTPIGQILKLKLSKVWKLEYHCGSTHYITSNIYYF